MLVAADNGKKLKLEFLSRGFLYFLEKRAVNLGGISVLVNGVDKAGKQIIILRFIYFSAVF